MTVTPLLSLLPLPLIGIPLIPASSAPAAALRTGCRTGQGWLAAAVSRPCEWAWAISLPAFPERAGQRFSANLPLLQSASLVGLYGLTLLALAAGLAPAFWIAGQRPRSARRPSAGAGGLGWGRLAETPTPSSTPSRWLVWCSLLCRNMKMGPVLRPSHLERLQILSRSKHPCRSL